MINALFGFLADLYPALIFIAVVAGLILLFLTWRRMSAGSSGAGPALVPEPTQLGLQRVPWDLQGIQVAIADGSPQAVQSIIDRGERLGVSVHVDFQSPVSTQLNDALEQIERALELPPLPLPAPTNPPTQNETP